MSELDEKLNCILADIGAQIGDLLRCIVNAEMTAHMARFNQLQGVLNGTLCSPTNESLSNQPGEAPPAA